MGSKPSSPAPPPRPAAPPPPPPAPPVMPPPPVVVPKPPPTPGNHNNYPPMTVSPSPNQLYPDGRGWYTLGGPKYGQKEVLKIIRKVLGEKADPPVKSGDGAIDQKALKIPAVVARYTKALCQGAPRFGQQGESSLKGKCAATGTDLAKSKDFKVKMDKFTFLKIAKNLAEAPGQVIIAEADNTSGAAQVEKVSREATIKDSHSVKVDSAIETGVNVVVEAEVSVSVVSVTARAETNLKVNFSNGSEQKFENSSTIKLEKEVKIPPFGHADVIWTINEGQADLPWEARFAIEGNYNLFYWVPPEDRLLVSMCATALEAFFEQGVMYKDGFEGVPDYLQKCGLHVMRIPVCEPLAWAGKVSEVEKDFGRCYWKTTGIYNGVKSTSWKSQVETRPVSRELDDWQLALYRGQQLTPRIGFMDDANQGLDQLKTLYTKVAAKRHRLELKKKAALDKAGAPPAAKQLDVVPYALAADDAGPDGGLADSLDGPGLEAGDVAGCDGGPCADDGGYSPTEAFAGDFFHLHSQ